ncbi:MAG: Glu-tRNA(Gln) amidotransferase subunit GatD [Candidatus Aenigmarchaeota archaeon]|nr:Glu-tRNA(Gln) amidotransferase subunit GatD [Candidatus Aenigmarchaeota archaeon]
MLVENYSPNIRTALKRAKIKVGDRITVEKGKENHEGLLMPRNDLGDKNALVIKLDSGYNIGIGFSSSMKISKSNKKEPTNIKEEVEFEMGKKAVPKLKFDSSKPPVSLISTGGTIASRVDYKTGGVRALEKPEELLMNVPELKDFANIKVISPFKKMSEDMDYKDWQKLAKLVAKELNAGNNVVITHGTDTLHFTAAALSFMLTNLHKPVVLVGSQRSIDRGSSDAFSNLVCATHMALSNVGEVGICMHGSMNDDYCTFNRGTRVRKMHTSRRDTFRTMGDVPIAKMSTKGNIDTISKYNHRKNEKVKVDDKFEPKVALLKAYPNSEPEILEMLVKKGYKGFVIEGTGFGHVPTDAKKSWINTIKKLTKKKIPVVVTAQTLYGRVNENVYTNLIKLFHDAGAIPGEDMLPEVAYVKLSWVLGHTKNPDEVKKMMLTNIAGEITERSVINTLQV